MNATHKIKPGWGYWDATNYPVGGSFHRAPRDGEGILVEAAGVIPQHFPGYGNLAKFKDADNRTLWVDERAFDTIHTYEVICGNIGSVYYGDSWAAAHSAYDTYVQLSNSEYGRAAGEDVTLMKDGEPHMELLHDTEQ